MSRSVTVEVRCSLEGKFPVHEPPADKLGNDIEHRGQRVAVSDEHSTDDCIGCLKIVANGYRVGVMSQFC